MFEISCDSSEIRHIEATQMKKRKRFNVGRLVVIGISNSAVKKALIRGNSKELSDVVKCGDEERREISVTWDRLGTDSFGVRSQP